MEIFGICKKESRIKSGFDEFWIFAIQFIHVFEYYHNWAVISQFWEDSQSSSLWRNLMEFISFKLLSDRYWVGKCSRDVSWGKKNLLEICLSSIMWLNVAQSLNSIWGYGFGSHQNQNFFRVFFSASAKIASHLWYSFLTSWNCNLMTFIMKLHNY